jgi:hypothetical protein
MTKEHMNKPSSLEIFLGLATPPEPEPTPEPEPEPERTYKAPSRPMTERERRLWTESRMLQLGL